MAAYELKYTAEEIDGILESVDEKTIYGDATQSEHGLMSTTDKAKLDSLPTSQQIDDSLTGKVDKVDGKGLSTNDYDGTAKAKVDAIPADPKYTDTVYDDAALSGRVSTIEGKESGWDAKQDALESGTNIKTVNGESLLGSGNIEIQGGGGSGEENVIEAITMNGASVPVTDKTAAITETDPTVPSWAKQPNKPSYNYSEIGNTPTIPVVPTNVSAFTNDAGYITSFTEQDPVFTASPAHGITSNDITNWNSKGTYSKPSGGIPDSDIASASTWNAKYTKPSSGIPASDLASGVIPTVPVQDVTVGGTSVLNNGVAVVPAIPDTSGKADKTLVASSMPSGGFLPNVVYNLGALSGNTTFSMAAATDNTIANIWCWTFTTPSTAQTITWPAAITKWSGGSTPTINASKSYEVTVMNGLATIIES